jgi:hypothetical protein
MKRVKRINMYISDYVRRLSPAEVYKKLPWYKRIIFKARGVVKVEDVEIVVDGEVLGVTPVYLIRCPVCGALFVDYPHGYDGYFICPRCGSRIY